jgi:hypothetical protein
VCAFSRTRSLSSSAWKVARSTTAGNAGCVVGHRALMVGHALLQSSVRSLLFERVGL